MVQDDLAAAFDENDSLVKGYQGAQDEFIREKTAALKVIERKLELDTSLQDHKQVTVYVNNVLLLGAQGRTNRIYQHLVS